jgi:hypothetical protein
MLNQKCTTEVPSFMAVRLKDLSGSAHILPILDFADNEAPGCVAQPLLRFGAWQCLATLIAVVLMA